MNVNLDGNRKLLLFLVVFATITGLVIGHVIKDEQFCDLTKVIFGITMLGYGAEYAKQYLTARANNGGSASSAAAADNPQTSAASAGGAEGAER